MLKNYWLKCVFFKYSQSNSRVRRRAANAVATAVNHGARLNPGLARQKLCLFVPPDTRKDKTTEATNDRSAIAVATGSAIRTADPPALGGAV
jgi:hypothetical protein